MNGLRATLPFSAFNLRFSEIYGSVADDAGVMFQPTRWKARWGGREGGHTEDEKCGITDHKLLMDGGLFLQPTLVL